MLKSFQSSFMLGRSLRAQQMIPVKLLMLIVTFAFLWTGTFLHDQFASANLPATETIQRSAFGASDTALSAGRTDRCPAALHVHSASLASGKELEEVFAAAELMPVWLGLIVACFALFKAIATSAVNFRRSWPAFLRKPRVPAYIRLRALLI
ncbi:MAG: hypothetical protein KGS72_04695 [Cyanobacteria bacterium REEB67]|nr:hypothetical protein [Cyanobacteria bacterium REEB67]